MLSTKYQFTTKKEIYSICGTILNSVKNAKNLLKMKHVKRHIIVYSLYNKENQLICHGNATEDWNGMQKKVFEVEVGRIDVLCVEETFY